MMSLIGSPKILESETRWQIRSIVRCQGLAVAPRILLWNVAETCTCFIGTSATHAAMYTCCLINMKRNHHPMSLRLTVASELLFIACLDTSTASGQKVT